MNVAVNNVAVEIVGRSRAQRGVEAETEIGVRIAGRHGEIKLLAPLLTRAVPCDRNGAVGHEVLVGRGRIDTCEIRSISIARCTGVEEEIGQQTEAGIGRRAAQLGDGAG